jgi:hypothetical protein
METGFLVGSVVTVGYKWLLSKKQIIYIYIEYLDIMDPYLIMAI